MLGGREPPVIPLVIPPGVKDGMECASVHQPPQRRERPAWSAASQKVGQERVTSAAGSCRAQPRELPAGTVTEAPKASEPV